MIWNLNIRRKIISGKDYQALMDTINKIKEEQRIMSCAEKRLYRILKHAKKVSGEGFSSEMAAIGSNICLKVNETGNNFNIILVLPGQEDVGNFKISVLSSLGVHLIASRKGDKIKYKTGLNSYKIQVLNIK